MISTQFQKGHSKEGLPTDFLGKIDRDIKIHTIRENYEYWKKRFQKITTGEGHLSLRTWEGKPYKSKQIIHKILQNHHGVGLQKVEKTSNGLLIDNKSVNIKKISINDGLEVQDFTEWFNHIPNGKTMALIHFSSFRY